MLTYLSVVASVSVAAGWTVAAGFGTSGRGRSSGPASAAVRFCAGRSLPTSTVLSTIWGLASPFRFLQDWQVSCLSCSFPSATLSTVCCRSSSFWISSNPSVHRLASGLVSTSNISTPSSPSCCKKPISPPGPVLSMKPHLLSSETSSRSRFISSDEDDPSAPSRGNLGSRSFGLGAFLVNVFDRIKFCEPPPAESFNLPTMPASTSPVWLSLVSLDSRLHSCRFSAATIEIWSISWIFCRDSSETFSRSTSSSVWFETRRSMAVSAPDSPVLG
uniref:(northern house mosquito) hypothetical protein n=1 Tax=Culex pipiens TaxID=7175 RepID=A0A8D8FQZ8_CULPI